MNRDLKFRVWNEQYGMSQPWTTTEAINMAITGNFDLVSKGTVYMQFTGMKDKNDQEMCEGDIVRHSGQMYVVTWDRGGFVAYADKSNWVVLDFNDDMEIIGNIYENPDLLPS